MALTNTNVGTLYQGNGVTTTFAIPATVIQSASSEIFVIERDETVPDVPVETILTIGAMNDYTIVGSNVVMNVAPTADTKILVVRIVTFTQPTDYTETSAFPVNTAELTWDKITAMAQYLNWLVAKCIKMQLTQDITGLNLTLPPPSAGQAIGWNDDEDGFVNMDVIVAPTGADVTFDDATAMLGAATLQQAIDVLDANVDNHIADATDAHDASAISNSPTGNLVATNVQTALNELQTELDTATAHISDNSAAHAATAIAVTPAGNLSSTNVQSALEELQTQLDGTGGSSADLITYDNATSGLTATDVQAAIDELETLVGGGGGTAAGTTYDNTTSLLAATDVQEAVDELDGNIDAHVGDTSGAHAASAIANTPSGNLSSTTVQAALNELQNDIDALTGGAAGPASGITYDNMASGLTANDVQEALDEIDAKVDAHIADTTAAHAASAISNTASGNLVATNVQTALNELQTELDAATAHISDTTAAHAASSISNTPSGNLSATDAQAAFNELQTELDAATAHISDSTAAHAASAIGFTPAGNTSSTTVQAAIEELQTEIDGLGGGSSLNGDNVDSYTAAQTLSNSNDYVLVSASSANYDISLPTAVGREGKIFYIRRTNSNFSYVITINPNGSETINTGGGTVLTVPMHTIGETWILVSDGANWQTIDHITEIPVGSGVASTIGLCDTGGAAPGKGTVVKDKVWYERRGEFAYFTFIFQKSAGGSAGSGAYLLTLPDSLAADTTFHSVNTVTGDIASSFGSLGSWSGNNGTSNNGNGDVILYDSTRVKFAGGYIGGTQAAQWNSGLSLNMGNGTINFQAVWKVKINGWVA